MARCKGVLLKNKNKSIYVRFWLFTLIFIAGFLTHLAWNKADNVVTGAAFNYKPHSKYVWALKENLTDEFWNTNSEGFRDKINFNEKINSCNKFVIALIGSSGFFGLMTPFEDTIGPQIERKLAEKGISAITFNFGVPGYSIAQGRVLAEDWISVVKPDLVLLNFGYVENKSCRALMSDSEYLSITSDSMYTDFFKKQLMKLSTITCKKFDEDYPVNSFSKILKVSLKEYVTELMAINEAAKRYSNEPLWMIPTISSNEVKNLVLKNNLLSYRSDLENQDYYRQNNFKYLSHLKSITDPKFFLNDGFHLNRDGTKKQIEMIKNELVSFFKNKLTRKCINNM